MSTEIIRRDTVEEIVGYRNTAIEQYRVAVDALERCKKAYGRCSGNGYGYLGEFEPNKNDVDGFRRHIDRAAWRKLVNLTLINELMDTKAREDFQRQIETDPPEVTVDNVVATLQQLMLSAGDIFKRSVIATFEALPREYKSNDGFKFGQRIIFDWAIKVHTYGRNTKDRWFSFYSHSGDGARLRDLDRVFSVLDGNRPDARLDAVDLVAEQVRQNRVPFDIQSRYFRLQGYVKGSLHVLPLRKDLLDKANRILADHYGWTLPEAA